MRSLSIRSWINHVFSGPEPEIVLRAESPYCRAVSWVWAFTPERLTNLCAWFWATVLLPIGLFIRPGRGIRNRIFHIGKAVALTAFVAIYAFVILYRFNSLTWWKMIWYGTETYITILVWIVLLRTGLLYGSGKREVDEVIESVPNWGKAALAAPAIAVLLPLIIIILARELGSDIRDRLWERHRRKLTHSVEVPYVAPSSQRVRITSAPGIVFHKLRTAKRRVCPRVRVIHA